MQNLSSRGYQLGIFIHIYIYTYIYIYIYILYIYVAYIAIMITSISWDTTITMVKSIHLVHLVAAPPSNRHSSDRRSQVPCAKALRFLQLIQGEALQVM